MIKLLFILPKEEDKELAIRTFREHSLVSRLNKEYEEEFAATYVSTLEPEQYMIAIKEADVVIARGATAMNIKRLAPGASVTEIPFSSSDIVPTVSKIIQENGNISIGLVSSFNMAYNVIDIADFFKVTLKQYIFEVNTPEEIAKLVKRARMQGCKAIVGGIDACDYARMIGLPAYDLPMGRSSIWQAISMAKHDAVNKNKERTKTLQFRTVLNYTREGIIAVDSNDVITIVNSAAERILGVSAGEMIGRSARKSLEVTKLKGAIESKELFDQILSGENWNLNVSKICSVLHGQFLGYVYVFQDVADLQETEIDIRRQVSDRGHTAKYSFTNIIGQSRPLQNAIEIAKLYAKSDADILISGDSGTGKELFAQSMHRASGRANGPFIAVNCAALPGNLIGSELFGYSEGAFTGAMRGGKAGIFELAHTGTVFLDEISELPLEFQGQLLRVFQEREIIRIGSGKVTPVDVRIICASNRPLLEMIQAGKFREDLYYRLSVLNLRIPSIKERRDDIIELVEYYLSVFAAKYSKPIPLVPKEVSDIFLEQEWNGNVREIRNICERLIVLHHDEVISKDEAYRTMQLQLNGHENEKITDADRDMILATLEKCRGNKTAVAKALGINRTTLWRKMKSYGISL